MRLWHYDLIPALDRQHLLGQHRECCALRGNGWGRKHATVDYVFRHSPKYLIAYHFMVVAEMEKRGYRVDPLWKDPYYRGKNQNPWIGVDRQFWYCERRYLEIMSTDDPILRGDWRTCQVLEPWSWHVDDALTYPEHNACYFLECYPLLESRAAFTDVMQPDLLRDKVAFRLLAENAEKRKKPAKNG